MSDRPRFGDQVRDQAARRLRARRRSHSVWSWLGMLGLIGWSVALPTVLGVALGRWLDRVAPATFSWVISLLVLGLTVGVLNAWFWVVRESKDPETETQVPGATSPKEVNGDGR